MELIIDSNINQLVGEMTLAEQRGLRNSTYWVARLTKYAEQKMRYHAPSRSKRATGKLKNSIGSEVNIKGYTTEGIAYVPESLGIYQFVIEGGREPRGRRQRGVFAFPVSHWKKGSRNANILKYAVDGKFIFYAQSKGIAIGKYKGSHFVRKSYDELINFFNYNRDKITKGFAGSLFITTSARV